MSRTSKGEEISVTPTRVTQPSELSPFDPVSMPVIEDEVFLLQHSTLAQCLYGAALLTITIESELFGADELP